MCYEMCTGFCCAFCNYVTSFWWLMWLIHQYSPGLLNWHLMPCITCLTQYLTYHSQTDQITAFELEERKHTFWYQLCPITLQKKLQRILYRERHLWALWSLKRIHVCLFPLCQKYWHLIYCLWLDNAHIYSYRKLITDKTYSPADSRRPYSVRIPTRIVQSLGNLTGVVITLLLRCFSSFKPT